MEISQPAATGQINTTLISRLVSNVRAASKALVKPTDSASLATFRVLFGAIMVWEVYRYLSNNRIPYYYIQPNFYFTYELFPFVTPLPGEWMHLVFFLMGLAALGIALGFFYRVSAILFFLTYTYVFLLDKAQYNNHYYLIIILAFLLVIVDAHRWASIDQKFRPSLRSEYVPYWHRFILLAQVIIVYFYAGVAKINIDWLATRPMGDWLERRSDYPVAGPFFETTSAAYFFSYGGLLFDLTIGFLLIWPRTRLLAVFALLFFHLSNKWLFSIGIFPYLMIAATILFVPPDWPRRILHSAKITPLGKTPTLISDHRYWVFGFVTVYLAIQILVPLRHWLYPSYVAWSEEGHRFSWRMKLRSKSASAAFFVTNPKTNERWQADPRVDLTSRQARKMATRPDMIIQYAHHLRGKAEQAGIENPIIQVASQVSLNGRPYRPMVDPGANLAEAPLSIFASSPWILPFEASFEDQDSGTSSVP